MMEIYRAARQIQLDSGNLHQWKEGYPSEDIVRGDIARGVAYVVLESGSDVPVGAFVLIPGEDPTYKVIEGGSWLDDTLPYATIHRLGSLPDAHGVAAACFGWCRQLLGRLPVGNGAFAQSLRIDTHEDNSIMRHCIARFGFRYCGVIHLLNGDPRLAFQFLP